MSKIQMFSTHDVSKWDIKPARANPSGQGKSIYMDRKDQAVFWILLHLQLNFFNFQYLNF